MELQSRLWQTHNLVKFIYSGRVVQTSVGWSAVYHLLQPSRNLVTFHSPPQ